MVPAPGSGIPGAPADGESAPNMERHTPVLFLDLNGECFQYWCKIHVQEHVYECKKTLHYNISVIRLQNDL